MISTTVGVKMGFGRCNVAHLLQPT